MLCYTTSERLSTVKWLHQQQPLWKWLFVLFLGNQCLLVWAIPHLRQDSNSAISLRIRLRSAIAVLVKWPCFNTVCLAFSFLSGFVVPCSCRHGFGSDVSLSPRGTNIGHRDGFFARQHWPGQSIPKRVCRPLSISYLVLLFVSSISPPLVGCSCVLDFIALKTPKHKVVILGLF